MESAKNKNSLPSFRKVPPKVPKREVGIVTLSKTIPNYSAKKLIELILRK